MQPSHADLITRLARIEGQVGALRRALLSGDVDCVKTLTQTKAASSGLKRFAEAFARMHARDCIDGPAKNARMARELDTIIVSAFTLS